MTVPWGIAVDGDDNIWVANFFGQRLSHLCGANPDTCPVHQAGAAISPARSGYFFDGLQRNTGVQIDASGNVWLTNNWKTVPSAKTGPYGDRCRQRLTSRSARVEWPPFARARSMEVPHAARDDHGIR